MARISILVADVGLAYINSDSIEHSENRIITLFGLFGKEIDLVVDPWPLCKTEVHLKMSEDKMLSFSVRKEIIEINNSLVVISLFTVGKNEFFQTL